MARAPQPSRSPQGKSRYKKSDVIAIITIIVAIIGIIFNFQRVQGWLGLGSSNTAPTPSVPTKPGVGHLLYSINDYSSSVTSLQWSQNGKRLSSTSEDGTTYEWDAHTGENRSITPHPNSQNAADAAIRGQLGDRYKEPMPSYDGKYVAYVVADSQEIGPNGPLSAHIVVKNKATGQVVITLSGFSMHVILYVFWSPSSSRFAFVDDTNIDTWDAATGKHLANHDYANELCHTCNIVSGIGWSPDSKLIATMSESGNLHLWDSMTGQVYTQYQASYFGEGEIRWSTDGLQVFISMGELTQTNTGKSPSPALEQAVIDVFSLRYNPPEYKLQHDDYLTCNEKLNRSKVQFDVASDNRYVAYSCGQGTSVYIWDLSQRKLSYTYNGHKNPVTYLAWSPNSCYIASAEEREVQVWQAIDLASCG